MDQAAHEAAVAEAEQLMDMVRDAIESRPELGIGYVFAVVVQPVDGSNVQPFLLGTNASALGQIAQLAARILEEGARRDAAPIIHSPHSIN